jgi:hypothetical protein
MVRPKFALDAGGMHPTCEDADHLFDCFEVTMLKLILPALALTATLCQVSTADAAIHTRHFRSHYHFGVSHRYRNDDTLAGYYEHRLDAVRFGSQRWWHIYDEQHGSGRRR